MTENNYMAAYNQNQQQNQVVYHAIELAQQEGFQSNQSPFIKDLPFKQQRSYLIEILGLFLIWTFINIFFIYLLFWLTFRVYLYRYRFLFLILFFIGLMLMVLFSILGLKKKNRKNSVSYYIANVLSYILTFYASYLLLEYSGLSWRQYVIISSIIFDSQISNLMVTIIMIVCLNFLDQLNSLKIIIVVYIILIPFQFLLYRYYSIYNFSILYTILLVNSLQQILKGRYKLKKDEVLVEQQQLIMVYTYVAKQMTIDFYIKNLFILSHQIRNL